MKARGTTRNGQRAPGSIATRGGWFCSGAQVGLHQMHQQLAAALAERALLRAGLDALGLGGHDAFQLGDLHGRLD